MDKNSLFVETKKYWQEETIKAKLIYPDENVIRFIKKNANREDTILDFGCGYGRHAINLALDNYRNIIAMDYNKNNLQHIDTKSKENNLNIKCIQNSELDIPLKSNSIDIVIAHGSLFYSRQGDLKILLANIKKVMKENAVMWCNFRTPDDDLIKKGVQCDKNFYKVKFEDSDLNIGYFSCSQQELRALFQEVGFEVSSLDLFEYTTNNQQIHYSWYILNVKNASEKM